MEAENVTAAIQRAPFQQVEELKKFCRILAIALALAIAAIGYLFATSGLHERNLTKVVVESDSKTLQQQVSALKLDIEALNGRINTMQSATDQLSQFGLSEQSRLSQLSQKVESGNLDRTYPDGSSIRMGRFDNKMLFEIKGAGGASYMKLSIEPDGPIIWIEHKDRKMFMGSLPDAMCTSLRGKGESVDSCSF